MGEMPFKLMLFGAGRCIVHQGFRNRTLDAKEGYCNLVCLS